MQMDHKKQYTCALGSKQVSVLTLYEIAVSGTMNGNYIMNSHYRTYQFINGIGVTSQKLCVVFAACACAVGDFA